MSSQVTAEGKNHLLDVVFDAAAASGNWYLGIIDNNGFTAVSIDDTLASHTGWNEASEDRLEWAPDAAANGSIQNNTPVEFTFTNTTTVKGIFLASVQTGTSGVLFSTVLYDAPITQTSGSILNVTFRVNP
jgi:hypothetical protein